MLLRCKERGYKQKVIPLGDKINICIYFSPLKKSFFLLKNLIIYSIITKILKEDKEPYSIVWSFSSEEDLKLTRKVIKEFKLDIKIDNYFIKKKKTSSFYVENICLDLHNEHFSLLDEIKEFNKYLIMTSEYSEKTNLSSKSLETYIKSYRRIYKSLLVANKMKCSSTYSKAIPERLIKTRTKFLDRARNNLNLFGATQVIFEEVKYVELLTRRKTLSKEVKNYCFWYSALIKELGESVGLFNMNPKTALKEMNKFLAKRKFGIEEYHKIKKLIIERHEARMEKNYKRSDEILEELSPYNLYIRDYEKFTYWEARI